MQLSAKCLAWNYFQSCTSTMGPILAPKSEELCGIYPVPANVFNFHPQNCWQGNAEGVLLSIVASVIFLDTGIRSLFPPVSHYSSECPVLYSVNSQSPWFLLFPLFLSQGDTSKVLGPFSSCHKNGKSFRSLICLGFEMESLTALGRWRSW